MSPSGIGLILHGDDGGMCHASNMAIIQAIEGGVLSSSSIMMPCPWAKELSLYAAGHPERDFGVHVTLTSEWDTYRWRPVAPVTDVPSLVDEEGFLWKDERLVAQHARPEEVERELRAQIGRARSWGFVPRHLDSHMGALFVRAEFVLAFYRVAIEEGIAPLAADLTDEQIQEINPEIQGLSREPLAALSSMGFPILKSFGALQRGTLEDKRGWLLDRVGSFQPGIHEVILHPSVLSDELRAACPTAEDRHREYQLMMDSELKSGLKRRGVRMTNWIEARERAQAGS